MSNVIDLPADVKKGDPVKAEDYNKLLAALRRSIIQPGTGYLRTINKSGTTLRIKQNKEFRPRINPPFSVIEVAKTEAGNYQLQLEPGRVSSANPVAAADGDDGIDYLVPEINGTAMDQKDGDGDFPKFDIDTGQTVYARIRRQSDGVIVGPVLIVAEARDEESAHYFPADPGNSGTEEIYQYRRILDFDVVNDEVEIKVWRRSDIDLEPYLWTGDNVGTGVDVFKEHDEGNGVYNFYRVNPCYGLKGALDSNSIKLDFEAENIGYSASNFIADVYVDYDEDEPDSTCADKAQFRRITQGALTNRQQIEVEEDNDVIRIQGNNVDKKIIFQDCNSNDLVTLEFEDGLLKDAGDAGDVTIQVPSCGSSSGSGGGG